MMQRRTWPAATVMAAIVLSVLCACAGAPAVTPTPTPSPTYECVPEKGGEPVPCGLIEFEQAQKRDALYAEAEAVFRRYWAEQGRLAALEEPTFTDVMAETTSGLAEQDVRKLVTPEWHRRMIEGDALLIRVGRLPGYSRSGSTVALEICADARGAKFLRPGSNEPAPGKAYEQRIYLAPVDGILKMVDADTKQVDSC